MTCTGPMRALPSGVSQWNEERATSLLTVGILRVQLNILANVSCAPHAPFTHQQERTNHPQSETETESIGARTMVLEACLSAK